MTRAEHTSPGRNCSLVMIHKEGARRLLPQGFKSKAADRLPPLKPACPLVDCKAASYTWYGLGARRRHPLSRNPSQPPAAAPAGKVAVTRGQSAAMSCSSLETPAGLRQESPVRGVTVCDPCLWRALQQAGQASKPQPAPCRELAGRVLERRRRRLTGIVLQAALCARTACPHSGRTGRGCEQSHHCASFRERCGPSA